MLQYKTIYPNKTSLSFSGRSIYDLMVEKMFLLWLYSKACVEHFTIFDGYLSEVLVTSYLCPTFSVNDLTLFVLCYVRSTGFFAVAGLLSLNGASHHLTFR